MFKSSFTKQYSNIQFCFYIDVIIFKTIFSILLRH